ncbi:MAG TPA: ATP-binding protein, partial [Bacillota bacterium]|nr:ATP-binding protein [Bacillota bacterium]
YKLMVLTPAYAAADILSTMSDSLILIGPDGKLLDANTATFKLLGYSREELINQPVQILLASREASFLKEIEIQEPLAPINTFKDYLMFYRAKNGADIPVSISGSVLRDQDHNLIGIVGVARDQREIMRLQANEHAYTVEKARTEALEERARELQAAYDKLKTIQAQLIQSEKMAAVGQLAGGVAHEINNPMGVILGFAQSISKRIDETHPLYTPLKSIEREAERCKKLVVDLLAFSRTGKTNPEIIDINTTIDETLSLITAQAKVKQIELIKEYETDLPRVTVHKNQLQQVIMNLCANAITAMPGGGALTITTKQIGGQIEISIREPEPGITGEAAAKEAGEGLNLGLNLCQEIIGKHRGVIEVESEAGNGSTVTIKLPIDEP